MIIGIVFFVIGGFIGWRRAARRGGTVADRVQYALAHGIPAFLIGMLVTVILIRTGVG